MDASYNLKTFPENACTGPFRENIRQILDKYGQLLNYRIGHGPVWRIILRMQNSKVLPFYIIEEDVNDLCNHCSYADWGHHLVCKRKYHFLIPPIGVWGNPINDDVLVLENHLLRGLIHCNGFGHLLCINGIDDGSTTIPGSQIMGFWDRICTSLRTRKVNVVDVSIRQNMDLKLLYGLAYGDSWFGRWNYKFYKGSFGVREYNYFMAIDYLSSLKLDELILDCPQGNGDIKQIISHYRDISKKELTTIRDIFGFLLDLKMRILFKRNTLTDQPNQSTEYRMFDDVLAELDGRYTFGKLQNATDIIIEVLNKNKAKNKVGSSGMTRQEARDAARLRIGDTGLIDYVLKVMNNVIVGNQIVQRVVNPSTKLLEFYVHDLDCEIRDDLELLECGKSVYDNVINLYKLLMSHSSELENVNGSIQTVLNSKHFVKQWEFPDEVDGSLRFLCRVKPDLCDLVLEPNEDFPLDEFSPGEYVVVSASDTISDLKVAVQNAMNDTYCIMERMIVTDILEKDTIYDKEVLSTTLLSEDLKVRGSRLNWDTKLRYEGGVKPSIVSCKCGATDDDGERMVSCAKCGDSHHTSCLDINNDNEEPRIFACDACYAALK